MERTKLKQRSSKKSEKMQSMRGTIGINGATIFNQTALNLTTFYRTTLKKRHKVGWRA
jgi:hypothetical protein